jgi:1L-myo-inositol 1-phosphate cytidylyltransferase
MNCLILAAGHGSRLRDVSDSKPLTLVSGKPLIEHVILSAAEAGARCFTVVTGHQAERVEGFIAALAPRLGLVIETVRLDDWDRPNGHSVRAGAKGIAGDYLLLMADHLFDAAIARQLLERAPAGAAITLAVDCNLANPLLDLDDATRVETGDGGQIVRIGKGLERFDAIDTGIFLATPALAAAIAEAVAAGGTGSLSEGVQRLADQGRAFTVDLAGGSWIDIDDPRALALAEALWGSAAQLRDNAA